VLQSLMLSLATNKYTIMYTTTPAFDQLAHSGPTYEPVFQEPLHMEIKRQFEYRTTGENSTAPPNAPLFEKYQFFTPGLFMGFFVAFILLSILTVAVGGVASLQVSYGAFDKEMGPAAQRKQQ